ncbi:hypothetical protein HMPREF0970_01628 [Schaalia odontolytica F0309]|uniref:Uncharacterized protein n=1 Tax=Schaalia odontolytica F0309 TaxID=649742 RepID=D4U092_9ACTO|nr:hypothetical protein HMPREF0970_01628 [Schaalia odontolytica F0309]
MSGRGLVVWGSGAVADLGAPGGVERRWLFPIGASAGSQQLLR